MPNLWRGESDAEIRSALAARFPSLRLMTGKGEHAVTGTFNIEHQGKFLAGFQIAIQLDSKDVLGLPTVRETGGRIPRLPERHVNPDGSACLYLPEDLAVRCLEPLGILAFLDGPVRSYFLGQAGFELGVAFPLGEWGHGREGLEQMLAGLLGIDDMATCVRFLELLSGKTIKAHWGCPCQSGKTLRLCHGDRVNRLRGQLPLDTRRFLLERTRTVLTGNGARESRRLR